MIWQKTQPNGPWAPPNKALRFGAATSDRVAGIVTTASPAALTFVQAIYPTTFTSARRLFSRRNASDFGIDLRLSGTTGDFRFTWNHAASGADLITRISNSLPLKLNRWQWIAVCCDTAINDCRLYSTTSLDAPFVEVTYGFSGDGSTTGVFDDSGIAPIVGNYRDFGTAFQGSIAIHAILNGSLSLAQLETVRRQWFPVNSNLRTLYYLGDRSIGTQIDWSGLGNHGTVTGAVPAPGLPLFEYPNPRRWKAAAAGGGNLPLLKTHGLGNDLFRRLCAPQAA